MMDLEAMLCAARDGQPGAWERLGRRLSADLYQFFRRWFDDPDAQDRTQDTLTIVLCKLPGFEPTVSLRAWVFGIAFNQVRGAFYAQHRLKLLADAVGWVLPTPSPGLSSRLGWLEEHEIIMEEVRRLPVLLREIIEYDLAGGDASSFAEEHGITLETVRTRRHRALQRVKTRLEARLRRQTLSRPGPVVDTPSTPSRG